jgi:hypothetical protein
MTITAFESEMREKYELPEGLTFQWFMSAIADFSLDISPLSFDKISNNFTNVPDDKISTVIRVLALMMESFRIKRERARIDGLMNIVGRDITLNSTESAKKAMKASSDDQLVQINERLHKLKTHAYN